MRGNHQALSSKSVEAERGRANFKERKEEFVLCRRDSTWGGPSDQGGVVKSRSSRETGRRRGGEGTLPFCWGKNLVFSRKK